MEEKYGDDHDLVLNCKEASFYVHRDLISQVSPVLCKMLNSGWIESSLEAINLYDDDPEALKIALDIAYGGLRGDYDIDSIPINTSLDELVDKYDLNGVRKSIELSKKIKSLQKDFDSLKFRSTNNINNVSSSNYNYIKTKILLSELSNHYNSNRLRIANSPYVENLF